MHYSANDRNYVQMISITYESGFITNFVGFTVGQVTALGFDLNSLKELWMVHNPELSHNYFTPTQTTFTTSKANMECIHKYTLKFNYFHILLHHQKP